MKYKCFNCGVNLEISEYQERSYVFDNEVYFGKCPKCGYYNEFISKKEY